jgi:hypothetical protein
VPHVVHIKQGGPVAARMDFGQGFPCALCECLAYWKVKSF